MTTTHQPTTPLGLRTFDEVTAVRPGDAPGTFTAELDPRWTVGGKPNGGAMVAILGRAASLDHPTFDVVGASAHFLRAPEPGPVDIAVDTLRAGRSVSQVRTRLAQGGRECVEALFTLGHLGSDTGLVWTGALPVPGADAFDDCIRLTPDPEVFPVPLLEQVEIRLARETMGWAGGRPTGRGELRGWLSLPGAADFDPLSLLFAVDAFPPATFDVQVSGWVPTHQLSAYIRNHPAPGPVQVLHRAHLVADGRVDESCFVWDSNGVLVAQATQLAGVRFG